MPDSISNMKFFENRLNLTFKFQFNEDLKKHVIMNNLQLFRYLHYLFDWYSR